MGLNLRKREHTPLKKSFSGALAGPERAAHARDIAGNLYLLGMTSLAMAKTTDFTDQDLIKSAFSCFAQSISWYSADPRPYLARAYVLLLFQGHAEALRAIDQALALEPENQAALDLRAKALQAGLADTEPAVSDSGLDPSKAVPEFGAVMEGLCFEKRPLPMGGAAHD